MDNSANCGANTRTKKLALQNLLRVKPKEVGWAAIGRYKNQRPMRAACGELLRQANHAKAPFRRVAGRIYHLSGCW